MALIPAEMVAAMLPLFATQGETDPIVRVRLFTPDNWWAIYLWEYDPVQQVAFGLASLAGTMGERDYFSLIEMARLGHPQGLLGLDLCFVPTLLSEITARLRPR